MQRGNEKRWVRLCGFGIVVTATIVASLASGSCGLESKTTACEQFELHCKEGQECAAHEAVCIDIGGCGNSHMDPGEDCDDGNIDDGDGCRSDCKSDESCGNSKLDLHARIPEACDHGKLNGTPDDNCDSTCHFRSKTCGDGIIDEGEECDPDGDADTAACNSNEGSKNGLSVGCKIARCGDGYRNMIAGEQCDEGSTATANCNGLLCTLNSCGDHFQNETAGEECDHGTEDTPSCNGKDAGTVSCHVSVCGDRHVNGPAHETCDRGSADTAATDAERACNGNSAGAVRCQESFCGDGHVNAAASEQCDDGRGQDTAAGPNNIPPACNGAAADSASCRFSRCGDGHKNPLAGEECDRGDDDTADGANNMPRACNGSRAGAVSCHESVCGDNHTNTADGEECDRGHSDSPAGSDGPACNGDSADGASCHKSICGDNHVNMAADEQCDAANGADRPNCNGNKDMLGMHHNVDASKCHEPTCGDGYINPAFKPDGQHTEECDDGNDHDDGNSDTRANACRENCQKAHCGDRVIDTDEQCEVGHTNCPTGKTCNTLSCDCENDN